jgi:general secretion pathway protein D
MDLNPSIEAVISSSSEVEFTPTIARREVSTTITVPDGRTIVIAGLTQENTTTVMEKVPLLGDIPLLGFLFRRQSDKKEKKNLLIFVTPRIVGDMQVADEIKAKWEEKTGLSSNESP